MKLLDRYIGRTVAGHILVVLGVLLSIYFFSTLVGDSGYIGQGRYSFVMALAYSLLLIPRQIYELFPLVALIGCMLGLGALANTSELTVMRAAGVSVRRIIYAVLKVGVALVIAVTLIGETVAPQLEKFAHIERAKLLQRNLSVNTQDGLWVRDGQLFINVKKILPGGDISDITLYRYDEAMQLQAITTAVQGRYRDDHWELNQVERSTVSMDGMTRERLESLNWETALNPGMIDLVEIPHEKLSLWDLYGYIDYLHENGLNARPYEQSFWRRVMAPISTAGMLLLAIPFIFGSLRSVGVGQRVTVGGLLGITFYLFNGIFSRVGIVYDLPPLLSSLLPTVLVFSVWWLLMRRVH